MSRNLALNASFEVDAGLDGIPDNWTNGGASVGVRTLTDEEAVFGDLAWKMETTDGGAAGNMLSGFQTFDVIEGQVFTVSIYGRATSLVNARLRAYMQAWNEDFTVNHGVLGEVWVSVVGPMTRYSFTTDPVPAGASKLRLNFGNYSDALASTAVSYWDAAQVESGTELTDWVPGDDVAGLGDFLTRHYQYEFRNFLFGSMTDFTTEEVEGFLDMPSTRSTDVDRQHEHGALPGALLMGKRVLNFNIKAKGQPGTDIEEKIRDMQRAFQAPRRRYARVLEPLIMWRPGDVKKMAYVRCEKRNIPSNYKTARGLAAAQVQFVATDPLIYSLNEETVDLDLPAGVLSSQIEAINLGDFSDGVYPTLTITGPATDPIIQNADDDNRQIKLDIVLGAPDTLVIYVKDRRITLNGVDVFPVMTDSQWWVLLPGANTIVYNRSAGNTGATSRLSVKWRHAWQ